MSHTLIRQIPMLGGCIEAVEINKGYSSDEKYRIHMREGNRLLLRLFDVAELEGRKEEFSAMARLQDIGVSCSRPVSIGVAEGRGYMVTSYIEGDDGEVAIPACSDGEQYNLGVEAGKELGKMHQLAAPEHVDPWHVRKTEKHRNYIDAYLECGVKVKDDQKIMKFIDDNIHLMEGRPNLFQHDDFHPGNIIVNNGKFAGAIDFNRYDWGDPVHDFLKIGIFTRGVSIPFSIGQIRGYFNGEEPDEKFWRLYSLYLAMCVFSSVVWAQRADPDGLDGMLEKVYLYLEDHDCFEMVKPKWYQ